MGIRQSTRGRGVTDRLQLPVLALLSAFLVGGIVLILSDLEFYLKVSTNPAAPSRVTRVGTAYWELLKVVRRRPSSPRHSPRGDKNKIGISSVRSARRSWQPRRSS
jgi:hypothetical protein